MNKRPIYEIAHEIHNTWKPRVSPYAVPYLNAMYQLTDAESSYGADGAEEIVLRFLANAGSFRGPAAKRLKAELKETFR